MSKIGRNDSCFCGSGKKYKKCCLLKEDSNDSIPRGQNVLNHSPVNKRYTVNHSSMPPLFYDGPNNISFRLFELTEAEFINAFMQGFSEKKLNNYLHELDKLSRIKIYFSRQQESIFFCLHNDHTNVSFQFNSSGQIHHGGNHKEIELHSTFYLFFKLIREEKCPWNFEILKANWKLYSKIAKSLFNFKNTDAPIELASVILNTDLVSEEKIRSFSNCFEIQKLNVIDLENPAFYLDAESGRTKTLMPSEQIQKPVFRFFEFGSEEERIWWAQKNKTEVLKDWNHLEFVFNDKTSFLLKDLLFHPYSVFLPSEIIPKNITNKTCFKNCRIWNEERNIFEDDFEDLFKITKLILENFIESQSFRAKKVALYLKSAESKFSPFPVVPINEILADNPSQYNWIFENGEVSGSFKTTKEDETIEGLNFILGKERELLKVELNSFYLQKKIFVELIQKIDCKIQNDSAESISALIDSKVDTGRFISNFKDKIGSQFKTNLSLPAIVKIPDENIKIHFNINYQDEALKRISFGLKIQAINGPGHFQLVNTPDLFCKCMLGLNGGLGNYFYEYDSKHLATSQQSEKRKNDLKLLRHTGIFKILLAEAIRYLKIPNKEKNKKNYKKFETELIDNVQLVLEGKSERANLNKSICSNKVKELMGTFLKSLLDECELSQYLFHDEEKIYQVNLKKAVLQYFESLLESLMISYGEDSFQKLSIKNLNFYYTFNHNRDQLVSKRNEEMENKELDIIDSVELVKGLLSTMGEASHDIYISGKKLQSLNDDSFISSLMIGESDGKINWFDMHPKVFFNGKELEFSQLQEMKDKEIIFFEGIPYHINFNRIPKLKFLDRFWSKLKEVKVQKTDKKNNSLSIYRKEKSLILDVLSMRNAGVEIEACEEWANLCRDFDNLIENRPNDLDLLGFNVPLKDYQKIGTQWLLNLYKIKLGGVLADDMGLGKTIQVIGFLEVLRLRKDDLFHLIIVPTSLIYNWVSEIKKFAPALEVMVYESKNKKELEKLWETNKPKIVIVTYGLLAENSEFFNKFEWNSVIFDEAQNIKNITSQRATAARSLKAQSLFCITGTPMENHYGEFYSLIDLCVPGSLGEYTDFKKTFSMDKLSAKKDTASEEKLKVEIQYLKLKTSPLVLRRLKSEILDQLPEKVESSILISFEKKQKEIYRNIAISWDHKIKAVIEEKSQAKTQLEMLTALLRLRQVCSFPAMIDKVEYSQIPPKLELLFDSIEEIYEKGESILIFTNFITTLKEIEKHLKLKGFKTHTIYGAMSSKERQNELQSFQENDQTSILIMTLKTGGVGLNLTKASYVFHIEPWWNPASENQATDRAHRMGQKKSVQVYKYIMKDSVEEKIQELKSIKGQAFDMLFNEESESDLSSVPVFKGQLSYGDFQNLLA